MSSPATNTPLGDWLTRQIERSRNTQNAVALYCGVSDSAISEWARGRRTPDPKYCWKLAEFFKVDVEHVMRLAGHLPPEPSDSSPLPEWLQDVLPLLQQLDEFEARTLEATAQTLLELRKVRGVSEAPGQPSPEARA